MEKLLYTFFFICFISSSIFSQNQGYALYKIKPPKNLDSIFSSLDRGQKEIMINSYQRINSFIEQQTFKLKFKDGVSHFKIEDRLESDNDGPNLKFVNTIYPESYYNHQDKTNFYISLDFNKAGYLVKVDNVDKNLILYDAKYDKIINGFICSLATIKYKDGDKDNLYKIWYSKDYNIPFGPSIYNGLPGLIIQVQEPSGNKIELKSLKLTKQNEICISKTLVEITEEEFNNIVKQTLNKFKPK